MECRFANTPRGRQQLFDHFADAEGNVRFSVKGRGDGKLKMRNKTFVLKLSMMLKMQNK